MVALRSRNDLGCIRKLHTHHLHLCDIADGCRQPILEVGRASRQLVVHTIGNRLTCPLTIHTDILAKAAVHIDQPTLDIRVLIDTRLRLIGLADHSFTLRLEFFPT